MCMGVCMGLVGGVLATYLFASGDKGATFALSALFFLAFEAMGTMSFVY